MEVAWISPISVEPSTTMAAAQRTTGDSGFGVSVAAEISGSGADLERAEALLGSRIRAPEGGCTCDAFISTIAPAAGPPKATLPVPDFASRSAAPVDLQPGSIVSFRSVSSEHDSASDGLTDHLHRAIVRNASEMISANADGLIEVLSIPWRRVTSAI